jgi:hypothetical protein
VALTTVRFGAIGKGGSGRVGDRLAATGAIRRLDLARSWQLARTQYAALVAELAEVKRERDEFRPALAELRAAIIARWEAEARLASFIASARSHEPELSSAPQTRC